MSNLILSKKSNKNLNIYFFDNSKNNYFINNNNSPSLYKEWHNFNISFNKNNTIDNLLNYNFLIDLIKSYFEMIREKNIKSIWIKKSFNKIFLAKPYIKFNNNKISITLFIFNREKFSRLKTLLLRINTINKLYKHLFFNNNVKILKKLNIILKNLKTNLFKFHKIWLNILSTEITRLYNKKVEFNIINIKNFKYNSDIFTEILALKIKKRKINIMNLYKNILINTIFYNKINNNNNSKLLSFIFEKIPYKNLKGISLLSKGRLTKRYKANRSIKLQNLIGGLNNVNFNNKYKSIYRNNINSNIEYSKHINKRRIGAFAIKGWISGKY